MPRSWTQIHTAVMGFTDNVSVLCPRPLTMRFSKTCKRGRDGGANLRAERTVKTGRVRRAMDCPGQILSISLLSRRIALMFLPKLDNNAWSTLAIESVLIVPSIVPGFSSPHQPVCGAGAAASRPLLAGAPPLRTVGSGRHGDSAIASVSEIIRSARFGNALLAPVVCDTLYIVSTHRRSRP
jgi:hypothetical protein